MKRIQRLFFIPDYDFRNLWIPTSRQSSIVYNLVFHAESPRLYYKKFNQPLHIYLHIICTFTDVVGDAVRFVFDDLHVSFSPWLFLCMFFITNLFLTTVPFESTYSVELSIMVLPPPFHQVRRGRGSPPMVSHNKVRVPPSSIGIV